MTSSTPSVPFAVRELRVEPMRGRHVTEVRSIDTQVYGRPWSVGTWQHELRARDRHHLVAVATFGDGEVAPSAATPEADTVVGHAGLLFAPDEAHITTVATDPEWQGRGVASRLLLDLFAEVARRDIDAVTLEVRAADRRAQRLYARFGLAPGGVRPNYYASPSDDAVVMWVGGVNRPAHHRRLVGIRESLENR